MEVLIDHYFDRLFEEMERSCLASRHKRRQLVKFFSDVIKTSAEGIESVKVVYYNNINISKISLILT